MLLFVRALPYYAATEAVFDRTLYQLQPKL